MAEFHIVRRDLYRGAALGALVAVTGGAVGVGELAHRVDTINTDLQLDRRDAALSNADFLKKNDFEKLRIGCSLAPEELAYRGVTLSPDEVADYIVSAGMTDVRMGLRWRNVDKEGKIDLSLYAPYIEALYEAAKKHKQVMNICMNIGPIKTFRYPEDHVPNYIEEQLKKTGQWPVNGLEIKRGSELSKRSYDYVKRLLPVLQEKFGEFSSYQIENEFRTRFGEHAWLLGYSHIEDITLAVAAVTKGKLLLTSPGVKDGGLPILTPTQMEDVNSLDVELVQKYPYLKGRIDTGVDYYFATPNAKKIIGTDEYADMVAAMQFERGVNIFKLQNELLATVGSRQLIAELQAEPWKGSSERYDPGNRVRDLRLAIKRASRAINITQPSLMYIWGIEHWMKQGGSEQKLMLDLTRTINKG